MRASSVVTLTVLALGLDVLATDEQGSLRLFPASQTSIPFYSNTVEDSLPVHSSITSPKYIASELLNWTTTSDRPSFSSTSAMSNTSTLSATEAKSTQGVTVTTTIARDLLCRRPSGTISYTSIISFQTIEHTVATEVFANEPTSSVADYSDGLKALRQDSVPSDIVKFCNDDELPSIFTEEAPTSNPKTVVEIRSTRTIYVAVQTSGVPTTFLIPNSWSRWPSETSTATWEPSTTNMSAPMSSLASTETSISCISTEADSTGLTISAIQDLSSSTLKESAHLTAGPELSNDTTFPAETNQNSTENIVLITDTRSLRTIPPVIATDTAILYPNSTLAAGSSGNYQSNTTIPSIATSTSVALPWPTPTEPKTVSAVAGVSSLAHAAFSTFAWLNSTEVDSAPSRTNLATNTTFPTDLWLSSTTSTIRPLESMSTGVASSSKTAHWTNATWATTPVSDVSHTENGALSPSAKPQNSSSQRVLNATIGADQSLMSSLSSTRSLTAFSSIGQLASEYNRPVHTGTSCELQVSNGSPGAQVSYSTSSTSDGVRTSTARTSVFPPSENDSAATSSRANMPEVTATPVLSPTTDFSSPSSMALMTTAISSLLATTRNQPGETEKQPTSVSSKANLNSITTALMTKSTERTTKDTPLGTNSHVSVSETPLSSFTVVSRTTGFMPTDKPNMHRSSARVVPPKKGGKWTKGAAGLTAGLAAWWKIERQSLLRTARTLGAFLRGKDALLHDLGKLIAKAKNRPWPSFKGFPKGPFRAPAPKPAPGPPAPPAPPAPAPGGNNRPNAAVPESPSGSPSTLPADDEPFPGYNYEHCPYPPLEFDDGLIDLGNQFEPGRCFALQSRWSVIRVPGGGKINLMDDQQMVFLTDVVKARIRRSRSLDDGVETNPGDLFGPWRPKDSCHIPAPTDGYDDPDEDTKHVGQYDSTKFAAESGARFQNPPKSAKTLILTVTPQGEQSKYGGMVEIEDDISEPTNLDVPNNGHGINVSLQPGQTMVYYGMGAIVDMSFNERPIKINLSNNVHPLGLEQEVHEGDDVTSFRMGDRVELDEGAELWNLSDETMRILMGRANDAMCTIATCSGIHVEAPPSAGRVKRVPSGVKMGRRKPSSSNRSGGRGGPVRPGRGRGRRPFSHNARSNFERLHPVTNDTNQLSPRRPFHQKFEFEFLPTFRLDIYPITADTDLLARPEPTTQEEILMYLLDSAEQERLKKKAKENAKWDLGFEAKWKKGCHYPPNNFRRITKNLECGMKQLWWWDERCDYWNKTGRWCSNDGKW